MLALFTSYGQVENIQKKLPNTDSLTVNVKFEKVSLSKEQSKQNLELNSLLTRSVETIETLSSSINKFTLLAEESLDLAKTTKKELLAKELGISKEEIDKAFKTNGIFLGISLLIMLVIVLRSLISALRKGVNIDTAIRGSVFLILYGGIFALLFYIITTLLFNQNYFIIKQSIGMFS